MNKPITKTAGGKRPVTQSRSEPADSAANEVDDDDSLVTTILSAVPEFSQTWMTSMLLHTGLIVVLAIITMSQIKDETITLAMGENSPQVESVIEMPLDFEEMEEPVEEFEEVSETFEEPLMETKLTEVVETSMLANSDFGDMLADVNMDEVFGDGEMSLEETMKSAPKFFKAAGNQARKIVYVVDNSNSMTGRDETRPGYGRMETALIELAKSVNSLEETQEFYIVFYSDTAYGLFHPQTRTDYIQATPRNKEMVNAWLDTVECCLRTDADKAFEVARSLKPQLIYLLGDGAFTDKADQKLINRPIEGAVIEALGMNLKGKAAQRFKAIAEAHGGTYRDVGLTPDGQKILAKFGPRKANNRKGPVWGIALPAQPKKKKQ